MHVIHLTANVHLNSFPLVNQCGFYYEETRVKAIFVTAVNTESSGSLKKNGSTKNKQTTKKQCCLPAFYVNG